MDVTFVFCDPAHPDAQVLINRLSLVLSKLTGDSGASSFNSFDVREAGSVFRVGYNGSNPIACGAIRRLSGNVAELKRMYAEHGTGALLLNDLQNHAVEMGYGKLWLSTRTDNEKAVGFYLRNGFKKIDNYGKYMGRSNSVCFEKNIWL